MQRFLTSPNSPDDIDRASPFLRPEVFRALYADLQQALGPGAARKVLLESFLWDPIYHHPVWQPQLLAPPGPDAAQHDERVFRALAPFLCLYRRLETIHGVARAQDLTAALVPAATGAFLARLVDTDSRPEDLAALRRELALYLGDPLAFPGTEEVLPDGRGLLIRVTRSAPLAILRAYELEEVARAACEAERLFFERWAPGVLVEHTQCLTRGAACCETSFRLA